MEQLFLLGVGLWILSRMKKDSTGADYQPDPRDIQTGRVKVLEWPEQTPSTIAEVNYPIFYVGPGGRTIGPGSACTLPNKRQLRADMIGAIQRLQVLASMWNQMNPVDRDSTNGDRIRDEVEEMNAKLTKAYQDLKNGCINRTTQNFSPSTSAAPQRMSL